MPRNLLKEIGQDQFGEDIPQSALGRRLLMEPEKPVLPPLDPIKKQTIPLSRRAAEPSAIGEGIADAAVYAGKQMVGAGEAAMSLASGMMLYVPSKIAGAIGSALGEDPRMVEEWFQTEFLPAYQPYTKAGQQAVAPIQKLFEYGLLPPKKLGEIVEKHTGSRDAGYAAEMAGEFATFGAIGVAGKIVKPKAKPFKTAKGQAEALRKEKLQARVKELEKPLGTLTAQEKLAGVAKEKAGPGVKVEGKPKGPIPLFKGKPKESYIIEPGPPKVEAPRFPERELLYPTKERFYGQKLKGLRAEEKARPKGEKGIVPRIGKKIEGKPVSPEERLIIRPKPDFIERAKIRVGGKPGIRETIYPEGPRNLVKEIKEKPPAALDTIKAKPIPKDKGLPKEKTGVAGESIREKFIKEVKPTETGFSDRADAFAKKIGKDDIPELKKWREEVIEESKSFEPQERMNAGIVAQSLRETIETAEGKAPKMVKPKKVEPRGAEKLEKAKKAVSKPVKLSKPKKVEVKDVTLESGGFQAIYEAVTQRIIQNRKAKGIALPKSDIRIYNEGKIVKQRKWKRRGSDDKMKPMQAPPLFEAEINAVIKRMPELRQKPLGGWLETPIRTFEELGYDIKEIIYRPVKQAEKAIIVERKELHSKLKELKKGVSWKSRKRIGAYAIGRQKRGIDILKSLGVDPKIKLTPQEMQIYNILRGQFESFYKRLNKARRLSGKNPFPKTDNYFTFFRDLSLMEKLGFNPALTKKNYMQAQFVHMKTTPFRFAKPRAKKGAMPVELDAFEIFGTYAEPAIKHIHLSPHVAKSREFLLTLKDAKGENWKMAEQKPRAAKFLTEWLDFVAGQKPHTNLPNLIQIGLTKLNRNLAFAILSANFRSALIQPSALRNTVVEIGPIYTWKGIESLLSPEKRNFAIEKSNVLLARQYDVAVTDAMTRIRKGKLGGVKKVVGTAAFKPLQLLDMEAAKATWQGAYQKAIEKMNFTERRAINYADDVVTRTQASAVASDIAPIQRTALGKTFSLFQTFVINEWGFLTKDVLGIKNAKMNNKAIFKKMASFIIGTTLVNMFYEDLLGVFSPYPSPIKAFQDAVEAGEDFPSASLEAAKEIIEQVPIIGGGLRYGKGMLGASVEAIQDISQGKKPIETAAKIAGIPGTAQAAKMIKAKKRGETVYGQFLGVYTPKHKRKKKSSGKLKGLPGGLKGGLKGL